jgi:NAD(P)-dependent dehydrogenase (short-subunit alcohol dehydrogenase family)
MPSQRWLAMELQGKLALVTGAGSGIGKAAAIRLARAGADMALLGRTESELEETAAEVRELGRSGHVLVADTSRDEDMRRAFDRVAKYADGLDFIFANAGVNGVWAPLEDLTYQEWTKTNAINLGGTFLTLHYAIPLMKQHGGSIVINSSINGTRIFTNAGASAYSASKAGQLALGQMAALELAQYDIRVNVICPGAIDTAIDDNTSRRNTDEVKVPADYPEGTVPLTKGRPGNAEDVAELVLFLASDRSRHITGTPIWIDGAQSLML